jgi:manganese oxidase
MSYSRHVVAFALCLSVLWTGIVHSQPRPAGTPARVPARVLFDPRLDLRGVTDRTSCPDTAVVADVVAIDHPMVFNRIGAQNVNWMMYALRHDIIDLKNNYPLNYTPQGEELFKSALLRNDSRGVALRPDLRPRPLVLRLAAGQHLRVRFANMLEIKPRPFPRANPSGDDDPANPFHSTGDEFDTSLPDDRPLVGVDHPMEHAAKDPVGTSGGDRIFQIDDQVASRTVGFHPQGLQLVSSSADDSSYVGVNGNSLVAPGQTDEYCFFAPDEGGFLVTNDGAVFGGEGTAGDTGVGLFGSIAVQPINARFYRSMVTEEEMRLATRGTAPDGQPVVDYEALYPNDCPNGIWCQEGKAGMPILNMLMSNRIVHSDVNAVVAGPEKDGSFPITTYPLEAAGKRNPTVPNRLEPFREFISIFHDENAATQAYPYFFEHPELGHTLHGVRDGFMINYGSGGIGSEIIANRLQAGPMNDCIDCAYEEFFLSALSVGDPAMLVDKPSNLGTGRCQPEYIALDQDGHLNTTYPSERAKFCAFTDDGSAPDWRNKKDGAGNPQWAATTTYYPHDPANVHHSYIGDLVKFRNMHAGKEQHIFHLHNHQWLFNPNDDNSNYIDAQGIGPGSGYTYEIAFGGSGNRNKTVGDAIFHCHYYPHFAQGMWYMWRNHDVMETGTPLVVSQTSTGFHEKPWALKDGRPADKVRALPDGEIAVGTPIPAVVPLPGKGMAPMPEAMMVAAKPNNVGSVAQLTNGFIDGRTINPGFPFFIAGVTEHAGVEAAMGSRPTTPPLDMDATAGGFDGGLPRHALSGYTQQGVDHAELDRLTAKKEILAARPVYFDEQGTPLEKVAMVFHATRNHATSEVDMAGNVTPSTFVVNGAKPVPGSPYNDPCIDDKGNPLVKGGNGVFFGGDTLDGMISVTDALPGGIQFGGDNPRIYKGANIQLDVVFNKLGYHYPQQRILSLWEDVASTLDKTRAPEPLVLRMNTFDCAQYQHTNLVPKEFYADDYQITTPTDVIGQHIHLPKWDLTSGDGSANGWNYEDGTFSPGAVRERIHAINAWNEARATAGQPTVPNPYNGSADPLVPQPHPYFGTLAGHQRTDCPTLWKDVGGDVHKFEHEYGFPGACDWFGARTTIQRWFSDPIVNTGGVHRGLGITFTHDHLGPSTHQQIGLYATMLTEPPGSEWRHNETGVLLATRADGGPTTWQAIITGAGKTRLEVDGDGRDDAHREFFLQFGDFQHAYHKGVFVGVSKEGKPSTIDASALPTTETFRKAINPSVRKPASSSPTGLPDIVEHSPNCPGGGGPGSGIPGSVYTSTVKPPRPCPEAISADDVGMMVVNYRNEPIAARVYDPDKLGPDGKSGMQGDSLGSDMAFALQTRTDRKCTPMNFADGNPFGVPVNPSGRVCDYDGTPNTPYSVQTNAHLGDPFTPIMRAYSGDLVRVKVQAGSHEHEHSGSVNGIGWTQGGSGFGQAPHSGWRNAQNTGLSEQFTFGVRITDYNTRNHQNDRMYTMDSSQDGMWNGVWGVLRSLNRRNKLADQLQTLPSNPIPSLLDANQGAVVLNDCPRGAPVRFYDVTAVLANQALTNPLGAYIDGKFPSDTFLDTNGGTLIYNPRTTGIQIEIRDDAGKLVRTEKYGSGPLHDPTAMLFVRTGDLDASGKLIAGRPLEPLVLRAAAGECIRMTLRNRLPKERTQMPDLDGYTMLTPLLPRSEGKPGSGSTSFNNNLIRPSNRVGLHPQLVHYDVQSYDGNNVGVNRRSTIEPNRTMVYQWYAGLVQTTASAESCPTTLAQGGHGVLSAIGGKPYLRPLTEVYDETAFRETATALFIEANKTTAGTTPSPTRLQPGRLAATVVSPTRLQRAAALPQPEANLIESFVQIAKDPSRNCLETAETGLSPAAARLAVSTEPVDSAPVIEDDKAAYDRTAVYQRRQNCAASLQSLYEARLNDYNRTEAKAIDAKLLSAQLAQSFVNDIGGVDDSDDGTGDAYRWINRDGYPVLTADSTRLVQFRPTSETNRACRFVDVEYGGTNLTPPDRIKQGQKAAVGALVIEPWKSSWVEYFDDTAIDRQNPGPTQSNTRRTRATANVTYPAYDRGVLAPRQQTMRDLVVVHQKGLNLRYGNKPFEDNGVTRINAVPNLAAEKEGADDAFMATAPEDAHDSGHMAINYGTEPMWFRFGLPADSPFGREGFGGVDNAWQAFSNKCCDNGGTATSATPNVGEPYVPIMLANAGQETRMRVLLPTGTGRGTVFTLHGHDWPRDPYLAEKVDANGFPSGSRPADWGVAARCLGGNPLEFALGGQESVSPMAHYDIVLGMTPGYLHRPKGVHRETGGLHRVSGDFLWRDVAGFGITSGLWGVMRVQPSTLATTPLPGRCHP